MAAGARPVLQRSRGLNAGLREAREEALAGGRDRHADPPTDLPRVSPAALGVCSTVADGDAAGPLVALVPDRHGRGTNALLLAPPDVIDVCFGGDSHAAHARRRRGRRRSVHRSGRSARPTTSTRPTTCCSTRSRPRSRSVAERIEAIAIDGLGEIVPGDDLPA